MIDAILPELLDQLSKVRIVDQLKEGGQKVVFRAHHENFGDVVLKVVVPSNNEEKERTLREIHIASNLTSDLFPRLYDFGVYTGNGNALYIVEELLPGENLRDIMASYLPGIIPLNETKRIISSLMEALTLTEPLNLIHRDIKPENVIVCSNRVVLIDFGIARHLDMVSITDTFAVFGPMTPGYAPPEQIRNEKRKISTRTDIFSLGVLFYELLTGVSPFCSGINSAIEAINKTLSSDPKRLVTFGFHQSFDNFIFQCLQKNCHRRPGNMAQAMRLYNQINWGI